jgi:hypothetical protein
MFCPPAARRRLVGSRPAGHPPDRLLILTVPYTELPRVGGYLIMHGDPSLFCVCLNVAYLTPEA